VLDRLQTAALDKPATSLTAEAGAALATFAVLQAESGDAVGAFATSERLRALEVRSGLATNEREISRGMSEDERAEERALAAELNTSLAQISREKSLPKPDAARIALLEKAAAETRQARRASMQRLFERHPQLAVWRGLSPPRTAIDAAHVLLDAGDLLVSFVLDDDDLLVLTVGRQQGEAGVSPALAVDADVMHVRRRHVNASIQALQQAAALNDAASWRKAVEDVAGVIPPAARARLASASRIMVIPHDVFWRVPLEALPSGDRLIGDHASVSSAGSLDSLIHSARIPSASAVTRMVGIGAPALTAERTARYKQVAPGWSLRTPEAADFELEKVSGSYDSAMVAILPKTSATESAVREQLNAPVLHFAAPFRINAASPLFSSILLDTAPAAPAVESTAAPETVPSGASTQGPPASAAPGSRRDQTNDGALELREVMNLDLSTRLAVFSDGAATSMRDGASAADVLEWGWLAAGVPSLLIARWAAPPAAGARLLAEFHKQVRAGAAPAVALRAAQLLVRSTAETSTPIHWAGWMLLGAR
jgi:CHAT domain-containing protein